MADEAIWRGHDRDALEWQYNARDQVPGHAAITAGWEERSRRFREQARSELDVPYGEGVLETMDLFLPETHDAPVHLFVHGGYWRSRDKADFSFVADPLVAAGALVGVVNYALCPHVTIDEIVRQVRAAAMWLWRNGAARGGDPARLHASGHSAGGHLVAMLAATDWQAEDRELPRTLLASATPISGLYELEPVRLHSMNADLGLDEEAVARLSPTRLRPAAEIPTSVYVGGRESGEFRWQSKALVDAWQEVGADVEYVELPGHDHFTILSDLAEPDFPLTRALLERMGLE